MKNESLGINDIQSCERGQFFDVLPVDSSLTLNTVDCNYDVSSSNFVSTNHKHVTEITQI